MGPGENGVAVGAGRLQAKIPSNKLKARNQRLRGLSIEKSFIRDRDRFLVCLTHSIRRMFQHFWTINDHPPSHPGCFVIPFHALKDSSLPTQPTRRGRQVLLRICNDETFTRFLKCVAISWQIVWRQCRKTFGKRVPYITYQACMNEPGNIHSYLRRSCRSYLKNDWEMRDPASVTTFSCMN
jgi:hypothetical protein